MEKIITKLKKEPEIKTKAKNKGLHDDKMQNIIKKKPEELKLIKLELSSFNPINPSTILNINTIKQFIIRQFRRQEMVLINIEFLNGDFGSLFVVAQNDGFRIGKGLYLFDDSLKYYNFTLKIWCYDFHEGFTLPIRRKFDIKSLNDAISQQEYEIELSTNPTTLQVFEESQMAKWMMKAQELLEQLKTFKMWMLITMVICILTFIIVLKGSGMLNNIHIPFLSK